MNETLILAIIAVAAAVLLLGMPFWLFGKRKNAVCVPAPVPGEEHRPATAEEITVLRKMVTDLFSGPVVNDGDRRCVREAIALWQPGTSFAKLMQNLVAELEIMPSVDRYQLYDYLREMRDSLYWPVWFFWLFCFCARRVRGRQRKSKRRRMKKTVFGSLPPPAMKSGCSYIAAPIPA
mgnify:CR=1 FL=1